MQRRTFLTAIGIGGLAASARAADTATGWDKVAALFPPRNNEVINLEFGAFGQAPRAVMMKFGFYSAAVNERGAYFTRRDFYPYYQKLRQKIAAALNADPAEIAITRNATEALQALIGGYSRLKPGDAVLMSDHDYDSMRTAMAWLKERRGVDVIDIGLPHPATHQGLIDAYEQALVANPKVRLILLTHISHRDGLRLPVREIIAMARARGVDAIVDSAHAWGQSIVDVKAEGFDFAGFNLHKWIGAPLGVGAVYIRKDRIGDIDPYMGEAVSERDPVSARVHTGTANFAAQMAASDALDVHAAIGPDACEQRFRYLRSLWAEPARELPHVDILTPADPRLHAGITSFRLKSAPTPEAHAACVKTLLEKHRIFTVARTGLAGGACIRVTPGFTTTEADMTALLGALQGL
ncbi:MULTISPECIES: aminotransferase class V-fold PLP-dependent enzyme [Asticcacaulis]|uniref:aminotransferase class V-fold PLP-dependent enzyme n=1 Tax=Asticcacaulis TaxID=76890 RepID=UPI001AE94B10|nr:MULTISPECIES: aminotransferase class V-fold PLP-dependent enzyme [Asticcacaulis]MBP2161274.1 selenocysteine lyase/cysteine desulfurase [Asticcacaulis solisilvae]MDR6802360.1 selenocysteine lyase/cysteine desulfurase [Asticcacaulis sp. BE141]